MFYRNSIKYLLIITQFWKETFMKIFGDHTVAIGLVISFSPYNLETILCLLYILTYLFYVVRLFKYAIISEKAAKGEWLFNISNENNKFNTNDLCNDWNFKMWDVR
jgi:hypothetical protein